MASDGETVITPSSWHVRERSVYDCYYTAQILRGSDFSTFDPTIVKPDVFSERLLSFLNFVAISSVAFYTGLFFLTWIGSRKF